MQMTCLREKLLEMSINDGIHPDLLFEVHIDLLSLIAYIFIVLKQKQILLFQLGLTDSTDVQLEC